MDAKSFMRDCYLKATPSVDIEKATKENPVDCRKHKLLVSEYEKLLEQYCETDNEKFSANMWCVCCGPSLVNA